MSLDEAARYQPEKAEETVVSERVYRRHSFETDPRAAQTVAADSAQQRKDKERWESAMAKARARGLDGTEKKSKSPEQRSKSFSKARRNPVKHAEVLLKETSLPFEEIADITGLDVYDIVGMKLKLRRVA